MSLPYDLALRLKRAGFVTNQHAWCEQIKEILPVPTLEELIDACKGTTIKLWVNQKQNQCGIQLENQSLDDVVWYETPLIAVAHLWLAINEKV